MSIRRNGALAPLLLLVLSSLALIVAGCGSSSSSPSAASSTTEPGSVSDPSAEFPKTKESRPIVTMGKEGSAAEREAASEVVVESLKAREAGDFSVQCKTLNTTGLKEIPGAKNQSTCPAALKKFAEPLAKTKEAREDRLPGSIDALRVKGENGYALFHGTDGQDYAVALRKEGGDWKLSAVNVIELGAPKPESASKPKKSGKSSNK
jgi:hypothetical protein